MKKCCCSAPTGTLVVTVRGCGSRLAGAGFTVDVLLSGVVVATGTTNGSGVASFTLPVGTYSARSSAARLNTISVFGTVTAGGTTPVTITLTNADTTNYLCACSFFPQKKVLAATVGGIAVTLTNVGIGWTGFHTFTGVAATHCLTYPYASGDVDILIGLDCNGFLTFTGYADYTSGHCPDGAVYMYRTCGFQTSSHAYLANTTVTGAMSDMVLSLSGTTPANLTGPDSSCGNFLGTITNLFSGGFTITE